MSVFAGVSEGGNSDEAVQKGDAATDVLPGEKYKTAPVISLSRLAVRLFMTDICVLLQFNDALMYTTPVQSAQYKLNSVLSLAGMKVRHTADTPNTLDRRFYWSLVTL